MSSDTFAKLTDSDGGTFQRTPFRDQGLDIEVDGLQRPLLIENRLLGAAEVLVLWLVPAIWASLKPFHLSVHQVRAPQKEFLAQTQTLLLALKEAEHDEHSTLQLES